MIQKVGPYFEKLAPPFDWKDNLQELHAHMLSYLLRHRSTLFNQEGGRLVCTRKESKLEFRITYGFYKKR